MVLSLTFVQVIHIPVTAHTRYWVLHSYVLNQLSSYINMYIQTTLINFTIDLCKLHRLDLQKSFMRCRGTLQKPLFIFEFSQDSALHNAIVLEQFDFIVDKAIRYQIPTLKPIMAQNSKNHSTSKNYGSSISNPHN